MNIEARRRDLEKRMCDPANTSGILNNGVTWFTRQNWKPDNKVLICLIIKTGSIYEQEGTYGIAHFIEHMLFNGTKSYEGEALIEELQRLGVGFGHDLNAYTSLDHTVYHLEIERSPANIEKALHILSEFAFHARLEAAHIEKERPIILEEKRARSGKGEKYIRLLLENLFAKTPYERLVIGTDEDISSMQQSDFKEFYAKFYTPENMAIAVVGDIDEQKTQKTIEKFFMSNASEDIDYSDELLSKIATTPQGTTSIFSHEETTHGSIQLFTTRKGLRGKVAEEDRMDWMRYTVSEVLSERCRAYVMDNDTPIVQMQSDYISEYTRAHDLYNTGCVYAADALEESTKIFATELERMRRFGPTPAEAKRVANSLRSRMEQQIVERKTTHHWTYLQKIMSSFIHDDEIGCTEVDIELLEKYMETIDLAELTEVARDLLDITKMVCIIETPRGETTDGLIEKVQELLEAAKSQEILPLAEPQSTLSNKRFQIQHPLLSKEALAEPLNMESITLASGVPCHVKSTDFQKDRFMIRILFEAGDIYLAKAEQGLTDMLLKYMMDSGTKARSISLISQITQEKNMQISLDEERPSSISLCGSCKTEDAALLLELLHDIVFETDWKEVGYKHAQQYMKMSTEQGEADPRQSFREIHARRVLNEHPSSYEAHSNNLDSWTHEYLVEYHQKVFHAQNMHVVCVSSLSVDKISLLLSTYFGSLPKGTKNSYDERKTPISFAESSYEEVFEANEDKATVYYSLPGVHFLHPKEHLYALSADIFSDRLRKAIRENMGSTYSIGVYHNAYRCLQGGDLSIRFSTHPDQVKATIERIESELALFIEKGISQDELERSLAPQRTQFEARLTDNRFWIHSIIDPWNKVHDVFHFDMYERMQKTSVLDINAHLKDIKTSPSIVTVLYPKPN